MNMISREELRRKLARGEELQLVMTLSAHAFAAKRIPTSQCFDTLEHALNELDPEQEVVVYCGSVYCASSIRAYYFLTRHGYHVRRYEGGIADWEAAGYRLESGAVFPAHENPRISALSRTLLGRGRARAKPALAADVPC
jgi:3-mercaptopyruvate sulfurtransferase SseA